MNRAGSLVTLIAAALAAASAASAAPLQAVSVGRLAFPDRAYVVDLGGPGTLDPSDVRVTENGVRVRHVRVHPLAASGLSYGVVLALDASDSMAGAPALSALDAARSFAARAPRDERIGVIAFNGSIDPVRAPTRDRVALSGALAQLTALSYGTRILDAVRSSVRMLDRAGVSSGAVVLLSDGADVGSRATLDRALAAARAQHVRVFTVGLRSAAFDATLLRRIARATGGAYAEAASPV